jgi:cobalt-precorrin 5A hydrolase
MKIAIVSLTKGGYKLALKISKNYKNSEIFSKYNEDDKNITVISENFKEIVNDIFLKFDFLIFIMSTGIVVRMIAPLLKSKISDPGIIVIDENGNNVISLLSGHLGGANEMTIEISKFLGSNPVITTASDVKGKIAVDVFAKKNDLFIKSMKDAKEIASIMVNDGKVIFKADESVKFKENFRIKNKELFDEFVSPQGYVFITNRTVSNLDKPSLVLIPKNIILGIGCRRGISFEKLKIFVEKVFEEFNLDYKSLKHIATVDIKRDEEGLKKLSDFLKVPLKIVDRTDIRKVENNYEISEFVKKQIGVGVVCEPCAELSSNEPGRFLLRKKSYDGITIAVWEEIYEIG